MESLRTTKAILKRNRVEDLHQQIFRLAIKRQSLSTVALEKGQTDTQENSIQSSNRPHIYGHLTFSKGTNTMR